MMRPRAQPPGRKRTLPLYPLAVVKEAVQADRFEFYGRAVQESLYAVLRAPKRSRPFVQAVFGELKVDDFYGQSEEAPNCDTYGIELSPILLDEFGIAGKATWYLKFSMEDDRLVIVGSLHKPKRPFDARRRGGRLEVDWRDP